MNIAIPSYNRYDTIGNKTLSFLKNMNGVKRENITIFVANHEQQYLYAEHNPGYTIVIGEKGIRNQRNFISNYYDKDAYIISVDDDVECLLSLDNIETNNLFIDAKREMDMTGICMWGTNPVKNQFFMKGQDKITHNLKFCIGVLYGFINKKLMIPEEVSVKVDYMNTIMYYMNYGGMIRFNWIYAKTKYFNLNGGIGSKNSRHDANEIAARYISETYPEYCKMFRRKDNTAEIRLNWCHRFEFAAT